MSRRMKRAALFSVFAAMTLFFSCPIASAQGAVTTYTGTLADGATYLIEVPGNWNGTLALYSHGVVGPGSPNPARDVGDPITGSYLLSNGYALAGSSYATTLWAVHEALPDQIAVLDVFNSLVGNPSVTIAWGHSLGGEITAGLIQNFPTRFSAALPMCGVLAGTVGFWNTTLDSAFAFNTLLAAGSLQIVHITDPFANLAIAEQLLGAAQAIPEGKARIALVAALTDTPGWFDPLSPEPNATDYAAQEANQFLWVQQLGAPIGFFLGPADLEARAGGNFRWNTGVNYEKQLERSVDYAEVQALYEQAGLSLDTDLQALNNAARIAADSPALNYGIQNIIFNGQIQVPVLTLHTTGDGLITVENEQAYAAVVRKAGNNSLLRETFVHRANHCAFTPAETIAAFQTLVNRLNAGHWQGVDSGDLNNAASALGPAFNVFPVGQNLVPVSPAFIDFEPAPFLRRFDTFTECRHHTGARTTRADDSLRDCDSSGSAD